MKDIAVAVACYNNENEVIEFAKNLAKQSVIDRIQLLITCNACSDIQKFKNEIIKELSSATVYDPGQNLGYLHGCLYGVKKSKRQYSWVMVSNTDIEFTQNDFFEIMIKDIPDSVMCIGPDIILANSGEHQNPFLFERPSKTKLYVWKLAYSNYIFFWTYFKLHELKPKAKKKDYRKSGTTYALHGSCFLIRDECVNAIMDAKPELFMYGEELFVAELIRRMGMNEYFNNIGKVIHHENQVTGQIASKIKQKWFKQSYNYLWKIFLK